MKVQHSSLPPTSAPSRSLSPCRHHNAPAVTHVPAAAVHEHPPQDLAHPSSTPAEHNPGEAHREPPNWQRGPWANQKKPAHGKKSKNPSPGLSPRVLHEPTYSADERRARQFSEGSPRCAAEAIVAVVLGHLVCLPLCLPEVGTCTVGSDGMSRAGETGGGAAAE